MLQGEVLQKTISIIKQGNYISGEDTTTISTLEGVTILTYTKEKITFYVPMFSENIEQVVISKKYGEYNLNELKEEQLVRILNLFSKRLEKSLIKYKNYIKY